MYKQTGGTSIGKKHAPDLCCMGAGKLEEDLIFPDAYAATMGTDQQATELVDWP